MIISNNEIPGLLQFATAEFKENDVIEMHMHESMTEIFYLINGTLNLIINEEKYLINTGDTFVIPPKVKHSLKFLESTVLIYFNLSA